MNHETRKTCGACDKPEQCAYGYSEQDEIQHEGIWRALAEKCWNSPSAFRLGAEAEKAGIDGSPFRGCLCKGVFEAGRRHFREVGVQAAIRTKP